MKNPWSRGLLRKTLPHVLIILASACRDGAPPTGGAVFEIMACRGSLHAPDGQLFRVRILDPVAIEQALGRVGQGPGLIVTGYTKNGDGGFNQPWNWHLDPASVRFAQVTYELCDGCPGNLPGGVQFCPWSTEVLRHIE